MHNRIVLDPYAHYPLMQFPHDFPLNSVCFDLYNNHTGPNTYYRDCSEAGGYRHQVDFDQIEFVDYKLFPITPITTAQFKDLEQIIHNPQSRLTLHLSVEDPNTDHVDYYLAPLVTLIKEAPKPIELEVLTRGELIDWRRVKNCNVIRMLFESLPTVRDLVYMHSVSENEQYWVNLNTGGVEPMSQMEKW